MRQSGALRRARSSRRVLDLRGVLRENLRQRPFARAARREFGPGREGNDFAHRWQRLSRRGDGSQKVASAVMVLHDNAACARLLEDIGEFGGEVGGIDGDEREARERGAELGEKPLRRVRGPDRHMLTGPETQRQRSADILSFVKGLREGPATPYG